MSNPRSRGTRSHAFAPPLYDSTNLPSNDARVIGRLAEMNGLMRDTGVSWQPVNNVRTVQDFYRSGDVDYTDAILRGNEQLADDGGGVLLFPEQTYNVSDLLTMDASLVEWRGVGEGSKIITSSTDGGIKVTATKVGISNLWLHQTGVGGWALRSDNGKIHNPPSSGLIGRGPEELVLRDLKVSGAAGIAGGIQLINTWFSLFEHIRLPGGDGVAIDIQSGGFNTFINCKTLQFFYDQGYTTWTDGLALYLQPAMVIDGVGTVYTSQQADDNLFIGCDFENVDRYCLSITSAGDGAGEIPGVGPARNVFVRCLFGANGTQSANFYYPNVYMNNAWRTTFINCNAEHAGDEYNWLVTATGQANSWYGCSGQLCFGRELDESGVPIGVAATYQRIQGNSAYDHVSRIYIDENVWGTKLENCHSDITDNGNYTRIDRTEIGTAGSLVTSNKVPYVTFSNRNATASGTSGTLAYFTNVPSDAIGSNGDIAFRDNPTAGAAIYAKESGVWKGIAGFPFYVPAVIRKDTIADNTPTALFTITTQNEATAVRGGAYSCNVKALVTHIATSGAANNAAITYRGSFAREMIATGTGVSTAVEDTFTGTSVQNAGGTRDIATVTMTIADTTEFIQTVSFTVDLSDTDVVTAEVTAFIEVLWTGFLTPPVIAAV
jgi:hypothetical protein